MTTATIAAATAARNEAVRSRTRALCLEECRDGVLVCTIGDALVIAERGNGPDELIPRPVEGRILEELGGRPARDFEYGGQGSAGGPARFETAAEGVDAVGMVGEGR